MVRRYFDERIIDCETVAGFVSIEFRFVLECYISS